MVGVARIELATPAMSRQEPSPFFLAISRFSRAVCRNKIGTNDIYNRFLPHFYRTRFSGDQTYTRLLNVRLWPLADGPLSTRLIRYQTVIPELIGKFQAPVPHEHDRTVGKLADVRREYEPRRIERADPRPWLGVRSARPPTRPHQPRTANGNGSIQP